MGGRRRARRGRNVLAIAALVIAGVAGAAPLPPALQQAVARGAHIFNDDSFGSHVKPVPDAASAFAALDGAPHGGPRFMTCAACHIQGGLVRGRLPDGRRIASLRNAAAVFPRYSVKSHRVMTLEAQIRHCVRDGIVGRAPAYGSSTMVDLVSYLKSIAAGQRIAIGGPTH